MMPAITAYRDQVDAARALLDVTTMTILVQSYDLDYGHRMFSRTPMISGTEIFGVVFDEHHYFGTSFDTVCTQSGQDPVVVG
ncbi:MULTISPECIES: hypothetical protein [unclassified Nocardia]|uniref:hypothetical protein n=1 Tax=unclassified Nocardia TaxID=2637762 RepID=UPI00278C6E91|nr:MULTISPECIES: hypothetical protein [unclassified Nocardia]